MPKTSLERTIDSRSSLRAGGAVLNAAGGGAPGVTDHGALTGLTDDDHAQYHTDARGDLRYVPLARQITAGAGLSGGGALSADRTLALASSVAGAGLAFASGVLSVNPGEGLEIETDAIGLASSVAGDGLTYAAGVLNVGAGAGLSVVANSVALNTPGGLSVSSANAAAGNHTHAIDSSSDPNASAALLATTAQGLLTLRNLAARQSLFSQVGFASGFAGSGWRVDYGITTAGKASAEFDDLTVRGRMRVYELLIQQIRATNGSLFVSSASRVVSVTTETNPAWTVNGVALTFNGSPATFDTTIYQISTAEDGDTGRELYHGFLYGDIIRAQRVEWDGSTYDIVSQSNLEVTGVTDLFHYQATKVSGNTPAKDWDFVRLGSSTDASRRGAVYITSDDSASPFIDIVDGIASHADWNTPGKIKVRLGKLTGISDVDFGGSLEGYGLYGQNVYLKGKIIVTGGNAATIGYVDDGLSIKADTLYVDAVAALKANLTYVDSELADAVAPLANITYVDDRVTHIDGGSITTGTINANRISAVNLAVLQAAVANLSALSANLGSVSAGQIVVGSTNKLWLNDGNDGTLRIGGSTKSAAPFQVSAAGYLTAADGAIGDLDVVDGNTFIIAPATYNITTKGYKFKYSTVIFGGLTAYQGTGVTNLYLDNNCAADASMTPAQVGSAVTAIRALAATDATPRTATVDVYAQHQTSGLNSGLHITNDPAAAVNERRTVQVIADRLLFNSSKVWHEANDGGGSGLDADLLDGQHASAFAAASNPLFGSPVRFSSISTPTLPNGQAVIYLTSGKRLVVGYYDGTNTKYRWMNLTGTDAAWNYQLNGSAPA